MWRKGRGRVLLGIFGRWWAKGEAPCVSERLGLCAGNQAGHDVFVLFCLALFSQTGASRGSHHDKTKILIFSETSTPTCIT